MSIEIKDLVTNPETAPFSRAEEDNRDGQFDVSGWPQDPVNKTPGQGTPAGSLLLSLNLRCRGLYCCGSGHAPFKRGNGQQERIIGGHQHHPDS